MESKRNSIDDEINYKKEEEEEEELELEEEQEEEGDDEEENNEILKRRISNHPLYGLLVEAHLDCLKVIYSYLSLSLFLFLSSPFLLL